MVVGIGLDGDTLLVATDNPLDDATIVITQVTGGRRARAWPPGRHTLALPACTVPARAFRGPVAAGGHENGAQVHINQMLVKLVELRGSDLHVTAGLPPMMRVDGSLMPMEGFEVMTPSKERDLVYDILSQRIGSASRPTWNSTPRTLSPAWAGSG